MIQQLQKKIVTLLFIAIVIGLLLRLFAGDGSLVHIYLLRAQITVLEQSVQRHQEANDQLTHITNSLKNDLDMVETIARRDLGMVHKDDVFFEDQ